VPLFQLRIANKLFEVLHGMRIVGMFLLGVGIMFLIMAVFFFTNPPAVPGAILLMLAWLAFVTVPMIVGAIAIIRKAERQNFSGDFPEAQMWAGENHADENPGRDARSPFLLLHQLRTFDLSRLNWIGWILLLGAFALVIGEAFLVTYILGRFPANPIAGRLLSYGLIFVSIAFFFAIRWLMRRLGFTIYRE
jgi:hypothetical protein